MSFPCGFCGKSPPAGTKPIMVVTKVRMVILPPIQTENPENKMVIVVSREKYETVEEVPACPSCAQKAGKPEVVEVICPK